MEDGMEGGMRSTPVVQAVVGLLTFELGELI
jgi:hypothetical protein